MQAKQSLKAEFYPDVTREDILIQSKYIFPLDKLADLGTEFSIAAAGIADAAKASAANRGLYRCVFPEGVAGHLASFKDGTGMLGTIVNDHGIAGQARWIPAEGGSAALAINPVTLAVAAAMMNINWKLDRIRETQDEILDFLKRDKQSKLVGDVYSLGDILEQYRINSGNAVWKNGNYGAVTLIKREAEHNIVFYRSEIQKTMNKKSVLYSNLDADKVKKDLDKNFKYYQLSIYISAYASFLDIILTENYTKENLEQAASKIRENAGQYRELYTECYKKLEEYMKGSLPAVAIGGIGKAGTIAGKALAKVPILSRGPVDEALIAAGNKLKNVSADFGKEAMRNFSANQDAGIEMFAENIETMNAISNKPVEILFDREGVYIC